MAVLLFPPTTFNSAHPIKHMAEFRRRDAVLAIAAIRANRIGLAPACAHAKNPDVVLAAIAARGGAEFEHADHCLKADSAFVARAVARDRESARHAALVKAEWVLLVRRFDIAELIPGDAVSVRILVIATRARPLSKHRLSPSVKAKITRVIRKQDVARLVTRLTTRIGALAPGADLPADLRTTILTELSYCDGLVLRHGKVARALRDHAPGLLWKLATARSGFHPNGDTLVVERDNHAAMRSTETRAHM